jgi:beta-galactosidase
LWSYQAIAHGAMGINYFRWDTATSGAEEYWHGMLNHDRSKSPAFDEILQTVKELKSLGPEFMNSGYEADTALYFDYDCSWAVKIQPGHYKLSYTEQATAWYGAISPSHTGIEIVGPGEDLAQYKVVFAPLVYVLSEPQADRIRQYVRGGGFFVSNFRLGVKMESSQIVRQPLPGFLTDVMGVTVEDYVPIYSQNPHVKLGSMLGGTDIECGLWTDVLKPSSAEGLPLVQGNMRESRRSPATTLAGAKVFTSGPIYTRLTCFAYSEHFRKQRECSVLSRCLRELR